MLKQPTSAQADQWEARLQRCGLTMEAGLRQWLIYTHMQDSKVPASGECLDLNTFTVVANASV